MQTRLELRDVSKTFRGPRGDVPAVARASFAIAPGEVVAVRGPSGCGKSTLLLMAGTLLRPDSGDVQIDGASAGVLDSAGLTRLRAQKIGFVFQQFHLIPYLTVLENILAPGVACPGHDTRARAAELLGRFGLEKRADHVPAQLSTGERQRTAMARALLNRPGLILADEPTGNLDEENGRRVLEYLAEFARQGGSVLLVTHDAGVTIATRTLRMSEGRLAEEPHKA